MSSSEANVSVKRIKTIGFKIDESVEGVPSDSDMEQDIGYTMGLNIGFDEPREQVTFKTELHFFPKGQSSEEGTFLWIEVLNEFAIQDLASFKGSSENKGWQMPDEIMMSLLGVSISHSRALLAEKVYGTRFEGLTLPLINTKAVYDDLIKQKRERGEI